ncbi:MAG: ABC transporter ATP-binding protein [Candidatus Sumerlaeota bacterium]|nr:ABC transporter ATP-binding protein [Candidatus Sumerlaeota bacterium]
MKAIETQGLTKTYIQDFLGIEHGRIKVHWRNRKVHALKDLNLTVEEGEIFGMLGPNGAGKTTAIKILMGIHFPTSGEAWIMGRPLGDKKVKEHIGFLPENPYFYDYLTGYEFLNFYGQLYGMPRSVRLKKIEEMFALVKLPEHAPNLPLKGYSKGMLQRIGLAQALLNDPKIVFLDEPQSGLDPLGRKEVRDIIIGLKQRGMTVFFSSHILSDAEVICDRVGIINRGELINIGRLNELLQTGVKEYEIVAADLKPQDIEALRQKSSRCVSGRENVLFAAESEDRARQIVQALMQTGGRLVSYTPRKETLEEFFIGKVTGPSNE